jgi:hypothetical protein
MDKATIKAKVEAMVAAPSCCNELKEAGGRYLKAMGTADEKSEGKKLIAELKLDVCTIDDVIGLFTSAKGEEIFGKEQAASMAEHAKEVKANGGKYCDCPACAPGKELMDAEADIVD